MFWHNKQTNMANNVPDSWCVDYNPAFKIFIQDLVNIKKTENSWQICFGNNTRPRPLCQFQLQVVIEKMMGLQNEIMIVSDTTGKAKVTRGNKVPGNFSWLKQGEVCSIVGTLVDSGKLPHVEVVKLAPVKNSIQKEMWPLEVNELRNYFSDKAKPNIEAVISQYS